MAPGGWGHGPLGPLGYRRKSPPKTVRGPHTGHTWEQIDALRAQVRAAYYAAKGGYKHRSVAYMLELERRTGYSVKTLRSCVSPSCQATGALFALAEVLGVELPPR